MSSSSPTTVPTAIDDNIVTLGDPSGVQASLFDIKDCVILFGKLAEKYIVLDPSGGQCCYSGCSNCEYRLPGGGYIMSDQSSSRPKWIPTYVQRDPGSNKQLHISQWSQQLFPNDATKSIERSDFINMFSLPPQQQTLQLISLRVPQWIVCWKCHGEGRLFRRRTRSKNTTPSKPYQIMQRMKKMKQQQAIEEGTPEHQQPEQQQNFRSHCHQSKQTQQPQHNIPCHICQGSGLITSEVGETTIGVRMEFTYISSLSSS
jgi:hypothetical protein